MRGQPLAKRKEKLEALMKNAPQNLHYSRHVHGNGNESFRTACESGMEGIVGKKPDSVYSATRNGDWIKLKCAKRQEFVIGGYTLSDKKSSGISSLLLGVYDDGELVYTGRAGTGLGESDMKDLAAEFEALKKLEPPFKDAPKPKTNETITWLKPMLVAEIKFAEWTGDKLLRQASFKGLRTDKNLEDIKIEKAEDDIQPEIPEESEKTMDTTDNSIIIGGIKITNPDKVMFIDPEITKIDVIRYYEKISKRMLPYVEHRILSIVRCPNGISKSCFFKKHPTTESKGIVTIRVQNSDGETEDYFYIENETGIISEAQMDTLEFHVWGSRSDELEKPDMMVFDLDPDEGMELSAVRQGVRDMRAVLSELSLRSYLKTSGGKGYHVVVPLKPAASWDKFHDFSKQVAEVMEKKWPDRYTSNIKKAKRVNKIFIDWVRNGRGATSVAPYSIRARKGARVSMPISWDELDNIAPDGIDMKEALSRINGDDPWKNLFDTDQYLI
ncbi:Multifunctional non-homologous end joining protein LigD [bioreactor metagenome]|uniref:Multifunctional non-homologous end joining protein LigD n=1 Tax=bioreactor metagenome TaxID=1076179 RepID=A0A645AIB6_9ZZZZ